MSQLKYWIGFNLVPGIGPVSLSLLLSRFGDLETAWSAERGDLLRAGLDRRAVDSFLASRNRISLDHEMEKLERQGIRVYTLDDPDYPPRLREIPNAPPVLYVKGTLLPDDEWSVAVVGTRKATSYGLQAAQHLVQELARHRITIVSGLARGIDAASHRACLEAGGRTIAVMGCGLDIVYPPEHASLAREITKSGALVSERPLGAKPEAKYFPLRNRIITGLSLGTLVVEAPDGSGALYSSRWALEQNREVFAVPGNIFYPSSSGVNRLIRDGEAKLVLSAQDILAELNLASVAIQKGFPELQPATDDEARLLAYLSYEPRHIDEVQRECGLPISLVGGTLAMMELKGLVQHVGGMRYVLGRATART